MRFCLCRYLTTVYLHHMLVQLKHRHSMPSDLQSQGVLCNLYLHVHIGVYGGEAARLPCVCPMALGYNLATLL